MSARGNYELFNHVHSGTVHKLLRDILGPAFDAFVAALVDSGGLDWEDDDLPIDPTTQVLIMALTFQEIATPAKLELPPDVVGRLARMATLA